MSRAVEAPRRGLWRTEVVRATLSGHSILGIAFAAIIYLVCLSGTVSVFLRDLQRWEQPEAPIVRTVSDAAVARAVVTMASRAGPDKPIYVLLPTDDFPRLTLTTGEEDEGGETWYADARGNLAVRDRSPWIEFVVALHTHLHLPETWGRFLVGLAGVALLSSLISGILAHPRVFRDAFHLRLGGSRRLEQADLHNRLGVWPLPFHLIVTLTGALLGLSTVIVGVLALLLFRGDAEKVYALLAPPPAKADARPARPPDIAGLLAAARSRAPGAVPQQMTITHAGRADARVDLTAARPRFIAQQDSISFDAAGRIVAEKHPADLNTGERILGSLGPLHFGWFGGLPIRLAYGLLGVALCVVTSSGISVWLARRRDKGRAAPGWERIWAAVSWGQPAVLALLLVPAIVAPDIIGAGVLALIWSLLTVGTVLFAAAVRLDAGRLASAARVTGGALLLIAALAYVARRGFPSDPTSVGVTVFVALLGLSPVLIWRGAARPAAPRSTGSR